MTATGSGPLDSLPPESKAMLSLLLVQGRSYQEIAQMLHMPPDEVRSRTHMAAEQLTGRADEQLSPTGRARIIDYLLGEQSVSERELTRSELMSLGAAREWATRLSAGLATLAEGPLPSIPEPEIEAAPSAAFVEPPPAAPAEGSPAQAVEPERPNASRWLIPALLIALIAAAVATLVIVLVSGSGSAPHHGSTASAGAPNVHAGTRGRAAKTVRRLVLIGSASSPKAFGTAAVISQHGKLLLLLQARGLAPNHHDSYGVWLYSSPGDARLLGFVQPPVGTDGTFSSSVALPDDAVRFHSLIVTLEHSQLPKAPGTTVLRSPLSLP